jgi:hypothetical protein
MKILTFVASSFAFLQADRLQRRRLMQLISLEMNDSEVWKDHEIEQR